ncbi:M20/M25/M40 family metallo-hydrolase [soil metagenome]
MRRARFVFGLMAVLLASCAGVQTAPGASERIDADRLMTDLRVLAADTMEGREAGTAGGLRARAFLLRQFQQIGLAPLVPGYARPFQVVGRDSVAREAANLLGYVRGTEQPERYVVVSAHYDHIGIRNGQIYNGADDNASGTAALLELARHFVVNPPRHSIIFAALDAEERGLHASFAGARNFVANPPVALDQIVTNVNMDMVGRNDRNELFAAGTYHSPFLRPYLERVAEGAPITLRFGHDSPELGTDDWTMQSDHGAFHEAGIPFIYFGVEDHPDYHRPTDTADRIQPAFFAGAVSTVLRALQEFDRNLGAIQAAR